MLYYILVAIKTMFGLSAANELVMRTNIMLIGKNIISFALILLTSMFLVLTSLSKIMSIYARDGKISLADKVTEPYNSHFRCVFDLLENSYICFSFFSFRQNVSYILSFTLGLYLIGSLAFILAMILVKLKTSKLASVADRR